jgi:hypothetical protein
VRACFLLSLGLFAGCGNEVVPDPYDLGSCGGVNQHCCASDTCDAGEMCVTGFCQLIPCGEYGQSCCSGECKALLACVDGVCSSTCGLGGEPCCSEKECTDLATSCVDGICAFSGLPTGSPCGNAIDCAGDDAQCNTGQWPLGYCVSTCDPVLTDAKSGYNPNCPGDHGVCVGGQCLAGCTAMDGALPCRADYACYDWCDGANPCAHICMPRWMSECDPAKPDSCLPSMVCLRAGLDEVGSCQTPCNLFAQDCDQTFQPMTCTVLDDSGTGVCNVSKGVIREGSSCVYTSDCVTGLTCFQEGNGGVCRPFCGGPMNVACRNGKGCVDFSTTVKRTVVGVCGGG